MGPENINETMPERWKHSSGRRRGKNRTIVFPDRGTGPMSRMRPGHRSETGLRAWKRETGTEVPESRSRTGGSNRQAVSETPRFRERPAEEGRTPRAAPQKKRRTLPPAFAGIACAATAAVPTAVGGLLLLLHVMVDVGHVVVLFETLHQFLDRLAPLGVELLGIDRQVGGLS